MNAPDAPTHPMANSDNSILSFVQVCLIAWGLTFFIIFAGHIATMPAAAGKANTPVAPPKVPGAMLPTVPVPETLTPRMQAALGYVSRRYRVSAQALEPIFGAAQRTGKSLRIDPLLIIAVIGIESSFNPLSESIRGAQGLMQVMPRYHRDKLPEGAGKLPFFDPVVNVRIGAQVLEESIRRNGGLAAGLQQFGGAPDDAEQSYAARVIAEKERLEQAARHVATSAA